MSPRTLAALSISAFVIGYAVLGYAAYQSHERFARCIATYEPRSCK